MSTLLKYFSSILTQQERPESPGNMACIEYISDPTEWKRVSYKKSDLYFCSGEC